MNINNHSLNLVKYIEKRILKTSSNKDIFDESIKTLKRCFEI